MNWADRVVVFLGFAFASMASHAALTVDFASAITDIGTVAAAVVGVLVVMKAASFVFRMIKGA